VFDVDEEDGIEYSPASIVLKGLVRSVLCLGEIRHYQTSSHTNLCVYSKSRSRFHRSLYRFGRCQHVLLFEFDTLADNDRSLLHHG
jgi:hypothetical protein